MLINYAMFYEIFIAVAIINYNNAKIISLRHSYLFYTLTFSILDDLQFALNLIERLA